jgi:O-Antigen ligase
MEPLSHTSRRAWDLLFWPLLAALGAFLFVKLVLLISNGLTFRPESSLLTALLALLGALLLIGVAARPELGLYLFILTFPLTNESLQLSFVTISLPNILLVIMAMSLIAKRLLAGRARNRPGNPIFWPKFLLLSWLIAATVISALMTPNTGATARFLVTRAGYALTFLVMLAVITDTAKLKKVLQLLVWSATAAAIVTIVGGLFPYAFPLDFVRCTEPVLPVLQTFRCSAFNLSFASLGSWVLAALAPAAASFIYPKLLGISRRLAGVIVLLLLAALVIAQSRGAWVALLVAIPIILAFAGRPKDRKGLALPAYLVFAGIMAAVVGYGLWSYVMQPIIAMRAENFWARLVSYQIAGQLIREHWLFGLGPLDERFLALQTLGFGTVDNSFLVEIAATGVLGAIPFLLLWFGGFRASIRALDQPAPPELHRLAGILGSSLLLVLVALQAYVAIGEKTPWILLGLTASLARIHALGARRAEADRAAALQGGAA